MDAEMERLKRTHVASVRGDGKGGFLVVLSDPALDAQGRPVAKPDTWTVTWDQWVASGARAVDL